MNLNSLEDAYQYIGRQTTQQKINQFVSVFSEAHEKARSEWVSCYLSEQLTHMQSTMRMPPLCKKGIEYIGNLLRALLECDTLTEDITMRAFSIRCYNDSKTFEKVFRDDFLSICNQYHPALYVASGEALSWQEQLQLLGIYVWPENYEFAGAIKIWVGNEECNLSGLGSMGIALPSYTANNTTLRFGLDTVDKVLFIENRTCYDEYILKHRKPNELVIFHGGLSGTEKRKFFSKLYMATKKGTHFCFWGDIDLGGFSMFTKLAQIIPELKPWKMDASTFELYKAKGLVRKPEYISKVNEHMKASTYSLFSDALGKILEHKVTIEQEVELMDLF